MIRSAFCTATAARHELQLSGGNVAAARSPLIKVCWTDTSVEAASTGWLEGKRPTLSISAAQTARSLLTQVQRGPRGPVCARHKDAPPRAVALRCVHKNRST